MKKLFFLENVHRNTIALHMNIFVVVFAITNGGDGNNTPSFFARLMANLKEFFGLWPWQQWATSLIGLILLYSLTGHLYNKWLSKTMRGHWLSWKIRVWLIVFDLLLNLALGLYYLEARQTIMGQIMRKCPIAISPAIFLLELFFVTWYYVYYYYLPVSPKWLSFKKKVSAIANACRIFLARIKNSIVKKKKDT